MTTSIDWPRVLGEIAHMLGDDVPATGQRVPAGTRAVAEYLGANRSTLLRWLDGSRLSWEDGERVLTAWSRLSGKHTAFAPRERRSLSAAQAR